jgi:outer membrane protein
MGGVDAKLEVRHSPDPTINDDPEGSRRSTKQHMNSKLVLVSAFAAGLVTTVSLAQTTPQAATAPAAAPTTQPASPPPQAVPAKIALIEYEEVAAATNEGQKAVGDLQKKYEPQKAKLDALKTEIDSLTKQLQGAPATMTDEEKASRGRTIDTKQKQLQRDADDAQNAYSADVQEAIGKVAQKLGPVVMKYVQQNGYTMLIDNTGPPQQGGLNVLWAPGTDISQAVVDAYNASSGVAAQVPSAPAAARPRPAAPKPTAPKQ